MLLFPDNSSSELQSIKLNNTINYVAISYSSFKLLHVHIPTLKMIHSVLIFVATKKAPIKTMDETFQQLVLDFKYDAFK